MMPALDPNSGSLSVPSAGGCVLSRKCCSDTSELPDRGAHARVAPVRLRADARGSSKRRRSRAGLPRPRALAPAPALCGRRCARLAVHGPLQPIPECEELPTRRADAPGALQGVAEAEMLGRDGGRIWALEHGNLLRAFAALPEWRRSVAVVIWVQDLSYL